MKQPTTTTTPILMFKAEPDPNRERMIKEWFAREKAGTTTVTTPTTPTTFSDLLHAYNNNPTDPTTLTDLAYAVTCSVLRKVIDPTRKQTTTDGNPADKGHNPALLALRASLTRDRTYLTRLAYATNGATRWSYDGEGNPTREIVDPDLDRAASALIREALTGGRP